MNRPSLIYRCPGHFGLGATLVMIGAYAGYCSRHGVRLALDMRRCQYFAGDRHAAFFQAFEIVAPDSCAVTTDPDQIAALSRASDRMAIGRDRRLAPDEPPPARVLDVDGVIDRVLAPWFGVAPPPGFAVRLKGGLKDAVDEALGTRQWDGVVGIHFRHGNGEYLQTREDFLTAPDYRARVAQFQAQLAARAAEVARGRPVFVAGDNAAFVAQMLHDVPGAFTLGTPVPEVPYIEYLRSVGPARALREAATDLWALAACAEIVCGPSSFAEAVAVLNRAARLHPLDDVKAGRRPGNVYAVHAARIHLLVRPEDPALWRRLSDALAAAGESEQAGACAQAAARLHARGIAADEIAALLRGPARIAAAVAEVQRVVARGAYEIHAARNMVRLLVNAGLPTLAEGLLQAVTRTHPDDAKLHALHADVLMRLARPADALAAARRTVELAPRAAEHRLLLAKALHLAGDPGAAAALVAASALLKSQAKP